MSTDSSVANLDWLAKMVAQPISICDENCWGTELEALLAVRFELIALARAATAPSSAPAGLPSGDFCRLCDGRLPVHMHGCPVPTLDAKLAKVVRDG